MNWGQFKDPPRCLCLPGAVIASSSLTKQVAGSNPYTVMTNIFVTDSEKSKETCRENSSVG